MQGAAWWLLATWLPMATAGRADEGLGCTAIAIDGAASLDGSAFAGMNADSAAADYRLTYVPPRKHQEAMRPVFTFNLSYPRWVGFGRGEFFHPARQGAPLTKPVGEVPEVKSTFGYYEATEPLINDQGLGFGESSCAALLMNKFPGDPNDTRDVPTGFLDTLTLMQLAAERCVTARCAAEVMGQLSEEFGFVPTPGEVTKGQVRGQMAWDDAGEAYTVADSTGEAWVFHVVGGVTNVTKSVWAARKVPKGHLAVVANEFTLGELPEEPHADFLFNREIFRAARVSGLWDGKGPLHFAKTFAPDPMVFETPTGATPIPLYGSVRRWALYNLAAPSLKLPFHVSNQDFPFSVKVEKPLSHRDVMGFLRYQYEGTEFDMTKGMLAGPFGNPFRLEGGPRSGQVARGIAILRTLYSVVVQTGPKRQLAWFAMDTPTTSVYVPLYARTSGVAQVYSTGHMSNFSRDAAAWAFNFVCNFMQLNYKAMRQDVYPAIEAWQDTIDEQRAAAEQLAPQDLGKWQVSVQEDVVASWWKMADLLIMKYNDGRVNVPKVGAGIGYPQWFADMVGFGNDIHPTWVRATAEPPASVLHNLVGYITPEFQLPQVFDMRTKTWSYTPLETSMAASALPGQGLAFSATALQSALTIAALWAGVALGRIYERRKLRDLADTRYLRLA